jgi:hypothetical protein
MRKLISVRGEIGLYFYFAGNRIRQVLSCKMILIFLFWPNSEFCVSKGQVHVVGGWITATVLLCPRGRLHLEHKVLYSLGNMKTAVCCSCQAKLTLKTSDFKVSPNLHFMSLV